MAVVEGVGLFKTYRLGGQTITVLADVSLQVAVGEWVVVAGESGSGKTTLLSLLSGLDRPSAGHVVIDGRDITALPENDLAPIRNSTIGFVFQSFHLIPALSAIENVMFPAELRREDEARQRAEQLLTRVGLAHRAGNMPNQLSGGEQQRVAVCRALINAPKVIFADEPTGNLDSANSRQIIALLQEIQRVHQTALIMATHSHELAAKADRVVSICDGRLSEAA
jgi:putative ABC transport system ATP-binding protein